MAWNPEDLQNPKWQRVRLEVMSRDLWTCQGCGASDRPLHVHHVRYLEGRKPWEYCTSDLKTLCYECHQALHDVKRDYHNASLNAKHEVWRQLLAQGPNADQVVEYKNLVLIPDPSNKDSTLVLDVPSFLYTALHRNLEHVLATLKSDPEAIDALRDHIRKGPSKYCHGPLA